MHKKRIEFLVYMKAIFGIVVITLLPSTSFAECTINGVVYPEEAVVSEYRCHNGEWTEMIEGESDDSTDTTDTDQTDTEQTDTEQSDTELSMDETPWNFPVLQADLR